MDINEIIISWQNEILKTQGIERDKYFSEIIQSIGSKPIKIISGFKRSGKSFIIQQIAKYLIENKNINLENILYLNFEDFRLSEYLNNQNVFEIINNFELQIAKKGKKYLFLDEIQLVQDWNKLIRTIYEYNKDDRYEIFITGSNSDLLSSEFGSKLAGRYIEFSILPFEFSEILKYKGFEITDKNSYLRNKDDIDKIYYEYLDFGGLPEALTIQDKNVKLSYFQGVITKVILDDIVKRFNIRNINDLEKILLFIYSDIGGINSIINIQQRFNKYGILKISENQIIKYINYIQKSFAIYSISKFDWKLDKLFKNTKKYYSVDTGLISNLSNNILPDKNKKLENIIFLHLNKYYKQIYFGRNKEGKEIDFIVKTGDDYIKIQTCITLTEENKKRELGNFSLINKYLKGRNICVIQSGKSEIVNYEGEKIEIVHIIDFLLNIK